MTVSPITKRYIKSFKSNKRGYISLKIFVLMMLVSLFSEFVTNDKPIFIWYKQQAFFPFIKDYPETKFGGDFETKADYQDPHVVGLIKENGFMVKPIFSFSYNTINYNLSGSAPTAPDKNNILGTDDQGRDVLARILYGLRVSVLFGLILTVSSCIVGIFMGAIQGYFAGKTDLILQRFMEVWSGLPELYILIIMASILSPSFWILLLIMLLFSWTKLVDLVRAEFLKVRNLEYVLAARSLGVKEHKIIYKYILPNALVATLTFIPFILSGSIASLAALDYLGLGLPSSYPSLGELLAQGHANLSKPWLLISGFCATALLLTLLMFIGEAVRDAFNYKKIV